MSSEEEKGFVPDTSASGNYSGADDVKGSDTQESAAAVEESTTVASSQVEDDLLEENSMPLLKYARLSGSLPRVPRQEIPSVGPTNPLSSSCTAAKLGRVLWSREDEQQQQGQSTLTDWWKQPHHVLLVGFQNGTLSFVELDSGLAVVESRQLTVADGSDAIVDVSLDASASTLAAINTRGNCCIFEVRYGRDVAEVTSRPASVENSGNPFASFLKNVSRQNNNNNSTDEMADNDGTDQQPSPVSVSRFVFKALSVQASRLNYPSSYGRPTCVALDPSYKRRREKLFLVGFEDGRLVLTKRGFFQRRNDNVIYQGTPTDDYRGIEAVAWRGSLVAWADGGGIKLYDIESMSRIAHVDRPAGARASLYPTVTSLRPSLCFETSDNLLIAWGDCVMTMHIKETIVSGKAAEISTAMPVGGVAPPATSDVTIVKRRKVECSMAWELDCIACGVVPFDKEHLIVLGLVPNDDEAEQSTSDGSQNDIELQVISRSGGSVTYADALPIMRFPSQFNSTSQDEPIHESANMYTLLSSFAITRMDDATEIDEEGIPPDPDFDFTLFTSSVTKSAFKDLHLRWDISSVDFDGSPFGAQEDQDETDDDDDSDDYGFIVRQNTNSSITNEKRAPSMGPVMIVGSPADLVSIRTRDIDDAVAHALSQRKHGMALQRALRHKRKLRKFDITSLADDFLRAVLCVPNKSDESDVDRHKLSIRRLDIAARSTPVLIGGDIRRWNYWVNEFSRIPGAQFLLCDSLPVRDPKLPPELYEGVLNSLLSEIETMILSENDNAMSVGDDVVGQAVQSFLRTLSAWGPSHALREKVRFQQYYIEQQRKIGAGTASINADAFVDAESTLQRRLTQSAAGYLELQSSPPFSLSQTGAPSLIVDSSSDSLFPLQRFASRISSRVKSLDGEMKEFSEDISEVPPSLVDTKVALDALAELYVMQTDYEMSLKCYLLIGSMYPGESVEVLERRAVKCVNTFRAGEFINDFNHSYGFVLAMVEHHHLHGCLLNLDFLPREIPRVLSPLISLIQLLGLDLVGHFVVEHCVPPPGKVHYGSQGSAASSGKSRESDVSRSTRDGDETIPINLAAEQFQSSPSLLHWYLDLIFRRKPELYIQFPTTAVPPRAVTELHRTHLDLHIEFAEEKDSALALTEVEAYNHERKTTPLLAFLKAALPLGSIRPEDVIEKLEAKRSESVKDGIEYSHWFALELAYVIENYGDGSEEESHRVLDLYLKGAKSLSLAAAYAQRNKDYATSLWETLIEYCLKGGEPGELKQFEEQGADGALFGSLLEAAALNGADLALLVTSIPQGMNIEGLRPRLVAAVADYRMKLKLHEAATDICKDDRVSLLRELGHRSRRGIRHVMPSNSWMETQVGKEEKTNSIDSTMPRSVVRHPVERPSRHRLTVQLPLR